MKSFGSFDNVEDAIELLEKTKFPYVLVYSQSNDVFRVKSSLGTDKNKVIKLIRSKQMKEIIEYNEQP